MSWLRRALLPIAIALTTFALASLNAFAVSTSWSQYHRDSGRSGNDVDEPSFATLNPAWTMAVDGAVYAEPLVYGGNVIVATENNSVYAFNASTGVQVWHINLGGPRTGGFPCGNIMPLGITGTPIIDGGFLYVVAEMSDSSFHLARINAINGGVAYNNDITPSGMNAGDQQERSALAVSNGNVVVMWGGLNGDCGHYHGYVETVAESSGARLHQWNNTANGNLGGIWGPSGAAVDGGGNIFVSTGNGTGNSAANYDYTDSVVKLSPSLTVSSYFAPANWVSLNHTDTDLGSMGPSLLPNGLLFALGKGGTGYLLQQGGLPSNSNGGGDNFSAQVCSKTSSAAFGGLAVVGNTVYVPCVDGLAAVVIDSANSFHTAWHNSIASGPPIAAGGLIWSGSMFGGTTLYGLNPSSGSAAKSLALPAKTVHFATPAAAYGRLFMAAGNQVAAFAAPNAPPVTSTPASTPPPPTPTHTATPSATPAHTATPSPSRTAIASGSASASANTAGNTRGGGGPIGALPGGWAFVAAALVIVAAGGGGGYLWWRRRGE
jgi:outer membrane protein assembly factor BamB